MGATIGWGRGGVKRKNPLGAEFPDGWLVEVTVRAFQIEMESSEEGRIAVKEGPNPGVAKGFQSPEA
jgi:hypothetical protein